jgi:hypothetical protein
MKFEFEVLFDEQFQFRDLTTRFRSLPVDLHYESIRCQAELDRVRPAEAELYQRARSCEAD